MASSTDHPTPTTRRISQVELHPATEGLRAPDNISCCFTHIHTPKGQARHKDGLLLVEGSGRSPPRSSSSPALAPPPVPPSDWVRPWDCSRLRGSRLHLPSSARACVLSAGGPSHKSCGPRWSGLRQRGPRAQLGGQCLLASWSASHSLLGVGLHFPEPPASQRSFISVCSRDLGASSRERAVSVEELGPALVGPRRRRNRPGSRAPDPGPCTEPYVEVGGNARRKRRWNCMCGRASCGFVL